MEITNELLKAYATNNVSHEERLAVRQYLTENPEDLETVLVMMDEDGDICLDHDVDGFINRLDALIEEIDIRKNPDDIDILPMTAMAAENKMDSLCAIRCECEALRHFGFDVNDGELIEESQSNGWLQDEGTALHNIGRLSGSRGLSVVHRYNCTLDDIRAELEKGRFLIAVVDGGELTGDLEQERLEDETTGYFPDHAVIVTQVTANSVSIQDSSTPQQTDTYPIAQFENAWNDSSCNLIVISNDNDYEPHPIDLSDVELPQNLTDLCEVIAENAHEVWAEKKMKDGWKYGAERDEAKKLHPSLKAYNLLTENQKAGYRESAISTIKILRKLGIE